MSEHNEFCNCEDCCYARGGEICSTCGCIVGHGCPEHDEERSCIRLSPMAQLIAELPMEDFMFIMVMASSIKTPENLFDNSLIIGFND